jgi:hypothetical protein
MHPSIEIEVEELARYIFLLNKNDSIIELSLGGIEDNKDLFYFCLDIFCKGLVLLFGVDNRIIINDLSLEQFNVMKQKMLNAGVLVTLDIIAAPEPKDNDDFQGNCPRDLPTSALYPRVNIKHIELLPNDLKLTDYKFEINLTPTLTYIIQFDITRAHVA